MVIEKEKIFSKLIDVWKWLKKENNKFLYFVILFFVILVFWLISFMLKINQENTKLQEMVLKQNKNWTELNVSDNQNWKVNTVSNVSNSSINIDNSQWISESWVTDIIDKTINNYNQLLSQYSNGNFDKRNDIIEVISEIKKQDVKKWEELQTKFNDTNKTIEQRIINSKNRNNSVPFVWFSYLTQSLGTVVLKVFNGDIWDFYWIKSWDIITEISNSNWEIFQNLDNIVIWDKLNFKIKRNNETIEIKWIPVIWFPIISKSVLDGLYDNDNYSRILNNINYDGKQLYLNANFTNKTTKQGNISFYNIAFVCLKWVVDKDSSYNITNYKVLNQKDYCYWFNLTNDKSVKITSNFKYNEDKNILFNIFKKQDTLNDWWEFTETYYDNKYSLQLNDNDRKIVVDNQIWYKLFDWVNIYLFQCYKDIVKWFLGESYLYKCFNWKDTIQLDTPFIINL